jgi:hypothetical protein
VRVEGALGRLRRGDYLAVHAPSQRGKTTWLRGIARALREEAQLAAVVVSCREAGASGQEPGAAQRALIAAIDQAAREELPPALRPPPFPPEYDARFVGLKLSSWARTCARPTVLLIDEVEALSEGSLAAVLSQLRTGYVARPRASPWAVVVCGAHDVGMAGGPGLDVIVPLPLPDFTEAQVATLYAQHTAETGQPFTEEAVACAFRLSNGRPWLVSALAEEVVERILPALDPSIQPIEAVHLHAAWRRLTAR